MKINQRIAEGTAATKNRWRIAFAAHRLELAEAVQKSAVSVNSGHIESRPVGAGRWNRVFA
jgi:hypothetical protein